MVIDALPLHYRCCTVGLLGQHRAAHTQLRWHDIVMEYGEHGVAILQPTSRRVFQIDPTTNLS